MGDLTDNFSRKEFACKCGCGFDTVDIALVGILEAIREHFGTPVRISSACRCASHNKAVGGASKSQHLYGRAADITVEGVDPKDVAKEARRIMGDFGGLGEYSNFVHVDSRTDGPARWRM